MLQQFKNVEVFFDAHVQHTNLLHYVTFTQTNWKDVKIITQKALKLLLQFKMMAVAAVVVVVMKISKILLSSRGKLEKK